MRFCILRKVSSVKLMTLGGQVALAMQPSCNLDQQSLPPLHLPNYSPLSCVILRRRYEFNMPPHARRDEPSRQITHLPRKRSLKPQSASKALTFSARFSFSKIKIKSIIRMSGALKRFFIAPMFYGAPVIVSSAFVSPQRRVQRPQTGT